MGKLEKRRRELTAEEEEEEERATDCHPISHE